MSFPSQKEIEIPLLYVLQELGGQAKSKKIYVTVAKYFPELTKEDFQERLPNSPSTLKWKNLVRWVRQNLVEKGEIDGATLGIWKITEKGRLRLITMQNSLIMNAN